ncbi:MAG TPA: metallopeptidase TldD-related protein [Phycisphaerae bacterium]|nr:metallopeptidase TldD-related protein [Phycisphaerae bacterium]
MRNPLAESLQHRLQDGVSAARRLGAAAAKISLHHEERTTCGFESGRLKDTGGRESLSFGIEVLVGRRKANTRGNRLDQLDTMIEHAVSLAKVGSAAHFDAYPPAGDVTAVKTHSARTLSLTREQLIESCQRIVDAIKAFDSELWIQAGAERVESESLLVTSGGVCHIGARTRWRLGAFVQRTEGTDMVLTGYGRSWCDLNEFFDPNAIAERIVRDLRWGQTITDASAGVCKAYLPPETLAMFCHVLQLGVNGRSVAKGESPLAGRLGQRVLDASATLIDEPHQDYASGAVEIDGDGVPTRRFTVFDKGVLRGFCYDLDSAALAGAEPTGHRGCRPYNLTIAHGERPSEQLLAGIDDGIYIRHLIGFGQGNVINGDFSCNVGLGYRICDGRIVGRVKNTMVTGNVYELFGDGVQLSSDLDHEGRFPHAVVDGMSVSRAER